MADEEAEPEPRQKTAFEIQLETCSGLFLTPLVSGMVIVRERYNEKQYKDAMSASTVTFLPAAGDLIGALISGFCLYFFGRRKIYIITNILFVFPLMLFVSQIGTKVEFVGIVIWHCAGRFLMVTYNVYVSEMSAPKLRAFFMSIYFISNSIGVLIGNFLPGSSNLTVLFGFILAIASLVLSFQSPESPYWLALIGKREEAETVFETLRAGNPDTNESNVLFNKAEQDAELKKGGMFKNFYSRHFVIPLVLVFFMLLANNMMCFIIYDFVRKFMEPDQGGVRLNPRFILENALPILGSLIFAGGSFVIPRRVLFLLSVTLGFLIFPLQMFVQSDTEKTVYVYCLCYLFAFIGGKQITRILPSEIFPSVVRDIGIATCDFMETLLTLIEKFSAINGYETWYYKVTVNVRWVLVPLGTFFTFFFMPETKDLTLADAEKLGGNLIVTFLYGTGVSAVKQGATGDDDED